MTQKNKLITEMYDNIKAFKVKLRLREDQLQLYNLIHFPQQKYEILGILTMSSYHVSCILIPSILTGLKNPYVYRSSQLYIKVTKIYLLKKSRSEVSVKV